MNDFSKLSIILEVSEFKAKEIFRLLKKYKVFLKYHRNLIAVLIPITEYYKIEDLLERIEDIMLGAIALRRNKKTDHKEIY